MSKYDSLSDKQLEKEIQRLQKEQDSLRAEKLKIKEVRDKRAQDERAKAQLDSLSDEERDALIQVVSAQTPKEG